MDNLFAQGLLFRVVELSQVGMFQCLSNSYSFGRVELHHSRKQVNSITRHISFKPFPDGFVFDVGN